MSKKRLLIPLGLFVLGTTLLTPTISADTTPDTTYFVDYEKLPEKYQSMVTPVTEGSLNTEDKNLILVFKKRDGTTPPSSLPNGSLTTTESQTSTITSSTTTPPSISSTSSGETTTAVTSSTKTIGEDSFQSSQKTTTRQKDTPTPVETTTTSGPVMGGGVLPRTGSQQSIILLVAGSIALILALLMVKYHKKKLVLLFLVGGSLLSVYHVRNVLAETTDASTMKNIIVSEIPTFVPNQDYYLYGYILWVNPKNVATPENSSYFMLTSKELLTSQSSTSENHGCNPNDSSVTIQFPNSHAHYEPTTALVETEETTTTAATITYVEPEPIEKPTINRNASNKINIEMPTENIFE